MKYLFLIFLTLLTACQFTTKVTPVGHPQAGLYNKSVNNVVQVTLVNGFTTAAEFNQLATCGKPFPLSDAKGLTEWQLQAQSSDLVTQTGPPCFDNTPVDHTYILAGWSLEKYDCGMTIVRRKHGGDGFKFYLVGDQSDCTIERKSRNEAVLTWRPKTT